LSALAIGVEMLAFDAAARLENEDFAARP
jgi:hypothetical protein